MHFGHFKNHAVFPRLLLLVVAISTALMRAAASRAAETASKELLSNGSFEQTQQTDMGTQPVGWTGTPGATSLDPNDPHTGQYCARIVADTLDKPMTPLWMSDLIPVHGQIDVSIWIKTAQVVTGVSSWHKAFVTLRLYNSDRRASRHGNQPVAAVDGTTPWTLHQWKGNLGDEVAYIRVECMLAHATGVAWFDDVSVQAQDGAPQGNVETDVQRQQRLEGERLQLENPNSSAPAADKQQLSITMDPPPAVDRSGIKRPDFFATIDGNGFYQGGKRVYLLGGESSAVVYPYLYRLLGLDFVALVDAYIVAGDKTSQYHEKDGNWHVSWGQDPYQPVQLDQILSSRLMPYIAFNESSTKADPLFDADPRLFAERGHGLSYSPLNPLGEQLRWDARQAVVASTQSRPVWAWQLFNETYYRDHDEANLALFQQWASRHYGDIEHANAAWNTHFTSFAQALPFNPGFTSALGINMPADASQELFHDFMKSQEEVFGDYVRRTYPRMKALDPTGYVTIKSTSNLNTDYVDTGVRPGLIALGEDIYGNENGQHLYFQAGRNDPDEINDMLVFPLHYDIIRGAAKGRPVIDEEDTVAGRGGPKQVQRPLTDVEGTYRFQPIGGADKEDTRWALPAFDDAAWPTIQVPGLWGKQGFATAQVGWYRRRFVLPAKPAFQASERVLLQGKGLTDQGAIYLNGEKIHDTSTWNEEFDLDVTNQVHWGAENVLAIRVENHYLQNGFYWGGIRDYLRLMIGVPVGPQPLGPGQIRTWLWNMAVHGCGGSVLSYVYANEASPSHYSPFSPYTVQPQSLKSIAPTHQLIDDLAPLVMGGPRRGRLALVYPIATFRNRIPHDYTDYLKGPLTHRLARYYGALTFDEMPLDVITDDSLLTDDLSRYEAIVLAVAPRVSPKLVPRLETYVRNGGDLLVTANSLTVNDDNNSPLGEVSWLPDRTQTGPDQIGARLGQGRIFMLPADASLDSLRSTMASLFDRCHIQPDLLVKEIDDDPSPSIEGHIFGNNGHFVWYLLNWGAGCKATVGPSELALQTLGNNTTFHVRDAVSGVSMNSPSGTPEWSSRQLSQGLTLDLPCQDPRVLLIEQGGLEPTPLTPLDPALVKQIEQAWHPTIPSQRRVLFDAANYERMSPVFIPTAVEAIEKAGWGVYTSLAQITAAKPFATWDGDQIAPRVLSDFGVVVYSCPQGVKLSSEQVNDIKQFVAAGGGLLLLANPPHGPFGWLSPGAINQLAQPFGITVGRGMISDASRNRDHQPLWPLFNDIVAHPVTTGIQSFDPGGGAPLQIAKGSTAAILIRGGVTANPPNAGELAVASFGKGRVAVVGGGYWLEPDTLALGNNQQLLRNLIGWLDGS